MHVVSISILFRRQVCHFMYLSRKILKRMKNFSLVMKKKRVIVLKVIKVMILQRMNRVVLLILSVKILILFLLKMTAMMYLKISVMMTNLSLQITRRMINQILKMRIISRLEEKLVLI